MKVEARRPAAATGIESDWDLSVDATARLKDCFPRRPEWHSVEEMTFDQAGELLDFLENQSINQRELTFQDNGLLTVRWFA